MIQAENHFQQMSVFRTFMLLEFLIFNNFFDLFSNLLFFIMKYFWLRFTKQDICSIIISAIVGVCLMILSTTIGNFILIEIRFDLMFSAYFGLTFGISGIYILTKTLKLRKDVRKELQLRRKFLIFFSILIILSGFICIGLYLDQKWNEKMNYFTKIPLYIILGVSLNFSLTYLMVDLINFLYGFFQPTQHRSVVETPNQIISFIFVSALIGFLQGLMFSALDIEDISNKGKSFALVLFEEVLLLPFLLVLGSIGGGFNQYLRIKGSHLQSYTFEAIHDPFTDEI